MARIGSAGHTGARALIVSADGFEDSELAVPLSRLTDEGIAIDIAAPRRGPIRGKHGHEVAADVALDEVRADDYDLLVLPGGRAPEALRQDAAALGIARAFMAAGKPVAAICHGPQILASAGVLRGRRATCYRAVVAELTEAGALYEDREVVVDGNLVTSRQPSDLPAFVRETMKLLPARPTPPRR
jgi:protease I